VYQDGKGELSRGEKLSAISYKLRVEGKKEEGGRRRGTPAERTSGWRGSPHWKHSELVFEKKQLIPALQQFLTYDKITAETKGIIEERKELSNGELQY